MLEERLIEIIESRAEDITKAWYKDVKSSPYTPSIKKIPADDAMALAMNVYEKLGYWLQPSADHEVQTTYKHFGEIMYLKGFRMEEVLMVLVLIKRHLWLDLLQEGLLSRSLEIYQALDLNNKVVLYFDRAIYFALIGYQEGRRGDKSRVKASR